MNIPTPLSRFALLFAAAALLLAVTAAPSHAQDEKIVTGVEMSEKAMESFGEMEELDAEAVLGMLNEGLFALECALKQCTSTKMRAVIMFLTEDDVTRVEGEPVEMESGTHSAEGVMPGDRVAEAWNEMTGGEAMQPDSADAFFFPDSIFSSEEDIADSMREDMKIGDGRVGLIMFLTVADAEMREKMGDALQIRPMGVAFSR